MNQPSNNEHILRVGVVVSVKGRIIEVLVDKVKNASHLLYNGEILRNVSVGSYVKITKGFEQLIGKIESEFATEDKAFAEKQYKHDRERIKRVLQLSLVGYFDGDSFQQGIKELPLIDNECYILTNREFNSVHYFLAEGDIGIEIGCLANETAKKIEIGINSLFASHIGIFGNTGSGKSYSLASLYYRLFDRFGNENAFQENARFLLIDFNGEYSLKDSITSRKTTYNLSTRKQLSDIKREDRIPISETVLIDIELLSILSNATEKTQRPYIKRALDFYSKVMGKDDSLAYFRSTIKNSVLNVLSMANKEVAFALVDYLAIMLNQNDSNIGYDFRQVIDWNNKNNHFMIRGGESKELTDEQKKATILYTVSDNYIFPDNCLEKVIHFLYAQLIYDLHTNKAVYEHISPAVSKLKSKIGDLNKVIDFQSNVKDVFSNSNFVIINLNDTNLDVKKTLPLILSKNIYDTHKKEVSKTVVKKFLNIIIDEAHNILSFTSERESETWKDYRLETFEEIIKEGRKFGVFLTIASQRPSDISATIISQLHNYLLHRLINNKDIEAVERTVSYLDKVSFDTLPILPTGSCILAGLSAKLPVILKMHALEEKYQPNSKTIKPTDFWITSDAAPSENEIAADIMQHNVAIGYTVSGEDDEDDELPV